MMIIHTKNDPTPRRINSARIDAAPYGLTIRSLERQGVTVDEIARRAGVARATVQGIATGLTGWLYPRTANALRAVVLDLLPSEEAVSA
jgi:predicted transcriptional regulator